MKKYISILALFLAAMMLFAACTPSKPQTTTPEETTPDVTTPEDTTPEANEVVGEFDIEAIFAKIFEFIRKIFSEKLKYTHISPPDKNSLR